MQQQITFDQDHSGWLIPLLHSIFVINIISLCAHEHICWNRLHGEVAEGWGRNSNHNRCGVTTAQNLKRSGELLATSLVGVWSVAFNWTKVVFALDSWKSSILCSWPLVCGHFTSVLANIMSMHIYTCLRRRMRCYFSACTRSVGRTSVVGFCTAVPIRFSPASRTALTRCAVIIILALSANRLQHLPISNGFCPRFTVVKAKLDCCSDILTVSAVGRVLTSSNSSRLAYLFCSKIQSQRCSSWFLISVMNLEFYGLRWCVLHECGGRGTLCGCSGNCAKGVTSNQWFSDIPEGSPLDGHVPQPIGPITRREPEIMILKLQVA